MSCLYCAIDCTVFIWDEMSDVESVAISFNNSLIAVNLTVSPGSGSNVCSRKLHRKINRGFFNGTNKLGEELKKKNLRSWRTEGLLSCGGKTRTYDLWVMSPTSYHCSTPRCSWDHFWFRVQRYDLFLIKQIFRQFSSFWEGKSYSWNNCPEISSALLENDWFISLL